tara:strand:+ start:245 stop:694 length:450 start_codon:yes stop_codon:yes gene_type:complete
MGIETRYNYFYYTVLDQDWFEQAERTLTTELTTEIIVNVINLKLKRSNDSTLNCFKVDYSQHSDDIERWIYRNMQHKECPIFVQIENNQPIITSGKGTLFVFYQEQEEEEGNVDVECDDETRYNEDVQVIASSDNQGTVDSLTGLGGIL